MSFLHIPSTLEHDWSSSQPVTVDIMQMAKGGEGASRCPSPVLGS